MSPFNSRRVKPAPKSNIARLSATPGFQPGVNGRLKKGNRFNGFPAGPRKDFSVKLFFHDSTEGWPLVCMLR
jgi:hypothetical protein